MAYRAGRAHRLGTKPIQTRHTFLVTLAAGGGPGCPIGPRGADMSSGADAVVPERLVERKAIV